jgi:hypothetical protein
MRNISAELGEQKSFPEDATATEALVRVVERGIEAERRARNAVFRRCGSSVRD